VSPRPLQHAPVPTAQPKTALQMPRIPGVPQAPPRPGLQLKPLLAMILTAVVCVSGIAFWIVRTHAESKPVSDEAAASQALPSAPPDADSDPEPGAIGTLYVVFKEISFCRPAYPQKRSGSGRPPAWICCTTGFLGIRADK